MRLCPQQGLQVFGFEADLGAGKILEIFAEELRLKLLATEKRAEISVTSLGSDFTRGHPQVGTDYGVEPQF